MSADEVAAATHPESNGAEHGTAFRLAAAGDAPTTDDTLGFEPYVAALAAFLIDEKTEPPLTVSIEGAWGSGKSSFMRQLEDAIRAMPQAKTRYRFVRFNAWRHDKDEELWAAFAVAFMRGLARSGPWYTRIIGAMRLTFSRLDWEKQWPTIVLLAARIVAFVALASFGIVRLFSAWPKNQNTLQTPNMAGLVGFVVSHQIAGFVAAAIGIAGLAPIIIDAVRKAWKSAGISKPLESVIDAPDYRQRRAFIEWFHQDFERIVDVYTGSHDRVFVFIDDLDRCEVSRAAELLQALNKAMSAEHVPIVYILGIDRPIVAAGIAAHHADQLTYLAPDAKKAAAKARAGIEFGFRFIEKLVQVPFRVPVPNEALVEHFVRRLGSPQKPRSSGITLERRRVERLARESSVDEFDSQLISDSAMRVSKLLDNNPRRIKHFVNRLRLSLYISRVTNMLEVARMNPSQLANLLAILERYPEIAENLLDEPALLKNVSALSMRDTGYVETDARAQLPVVARWWARTDLREFLQIIGKDTHQSLAGVDLLPFLQTHPRRDTPQAATPPSGP